MSRIGLLGAVALATVIVGSGVEAQTPIPPAPKDFVMAAAQSDRYEIMAAHLAAVQSQDPHVRNFAEQMISDHTRMIEELREAATATGLSSPTLGMSSDQAALLGSLQGLRGTDFDKTYARQQVLAHTQALTVQDSFAQAGAKSDLRTAAAASLPTIRDHLRMAEQLRQEVGGN